MEYKHVVIRCLGGSKVLEVVKDELSEPKSGEVRVRILTAGISYADMLMREGVHPETPRTPVLDLTGKVRV